MVSSATDADADSSIASPDSDPPGSERISSSSISAAPASTARVDAARDAGAELDNETERMVRFLVDNLPEAVIVHQRGRVVLANAAVADLLGYESSAALIGIDWRELIHPGDLNEASRNVSGATNTPGLNRFGAVSRRLVRQSGETLDTEVMALGIPWRGEQALLVITRGATERYRIEATLRERDRMAAVGTLAAGVAHEINNPLAYIIANLSFARGLADELGSKVPDAQRQEMVEALEEARQGAERVRQVVRDLKTFTRDHARPELVHLPRVIDSTVKMASTELRHRARVVTDYRPASLVHANETRLAQVFLNLLVNAAQAFEEVAPGNLVQVQVRGVDQTVQVTITDNGVGIPLENIDRVTDPFFTTKPVGVGTGLGLSVCRNIVQSYGGTLEITSKLGTGTTVRVTLPAKSDSQEEEPQSSHPRDGFGVRRRVLVIDDEPLVLRSLKRLLKQHDVTICDQADVALKMMTDGLEFDLILCDLMMPDMSGMELFDAVVRVAPRMAPRFRFVSGGAVTAEARDFLQRVPNARYEKPLLPEQVQQLLNAVDA